MVTDPATPLMLRMDDVGAASKRHEVYGLTRIAVRRTRIPFPGNFLWLKYLPPIKRWGPYRELTAPEWQSILEALAAARARMTVAVTAAWVEDDGRLTPFPAKFPDAVAKATGERPRLPARLRDLMERVERVDGLPNDLAALETMIDERMALAREPAPVRAKVRT